MREASALLLALVFGCTAVRTIPKTELTRLDGYVYEKKSFLQRAKEAVNSASAYELHDVDGESHAFSESTRLVLGARGNDPVENRYRSVTVRDGELRAEALSGQPLQLQLADIDVVGVREFSLGRTLGLVGGILGVVVVGLAVLVANVEPSENSSGGGGHDFD
jgi:hypothetical protein